MAGGTIILMSPRLLLKHEGVLGMALEVNLADLVVFESQIGYIQDLLASLSQMGLEIEHVLGQRGR